jgi:hypothetical protein
LRAPDHSAKADVRAPFRFRPRHVGPAASLRETIAVSGTTL